MALWMKADALSGACTSVRRNQQRCSGIVILLSVFISFQGCRPQRTSEYRIEIIKWNCKHTDENVTCAVTARTHGQEGFEAQFVREFKDAEGKRVNTCAECNQTTSDMPSKDEEEKNKSYTIVLGPAEDESLRMFLIMHPDSFPIREYAFYFTDPTTGQRVSNVADGQVFEVQ
jgi:hypothetical protein